jgi:replicative DNA helicase
MDASPSLSLLDIRARADRILLERGPAMRVVDDHQRLTTDRRQDTRRQELADIGRVLKILAKNLKGPIVALSRLRGAVESR